MEYRGIEGARLSHLGMGCMRLPTTLGKVDAKRAQQIIDYAMEHGVNYFDTAYIYHAGQSEKFLGRAMRKYPRESFCLATKYFLTGFRNYRKVFESQLKRLQTDYVDFYLVHSVLDATARAYEKNGCIEYFAEQKAKGRIRHLGFSSHAGLDKLEHFCGIHDWDFVQLQINYYDWTFGTARRQYEIACSHGLPIVVMEPVRGGKLATLSPDSRAILERVHPDWSPASWAMRWVMRLPNVKVVLSGMGDLDQIADNVATFDSRPLTDEETDTLMQACGAFKQQVAVFCTACRYCTHACPAHIDIPAVLDVYNRYKLDGAWGIADELGKFPEGSRPADCIGCGACAKRCPQGIDIPAVMRELAAV